MPAEHSIELDRNPQAPRVARQRVSDWLREAVDGHRLEDVKLLVSELVTNAVRHAPNGDGRIELQVAVAPRRVRIEVGDPGHGFHVGRVGPPPPDALGGRGLLIVDRVASRWGVARGPRTRVWFELDR